MTPPARGRAHPQEGWRAVRANFPIRHAHAQAHPKTRRPSQMSGRSHRAPTHLEKGEGVAPPHPHPPCRESRTPLQIERGKPEQRERSVVAVRAGLAAVWFRLVETRVWQVLQEPFRNMNPFDPPNSPLGNYIISPSVQIKQASL